MIRGEQVVLIIKTETSKDAFGAPVYSESQVTVDNVVVGNSTANEHVNNLDLHGARIAFVLGIPKTDNHIWENTDVYIRGMRFRTIGAPLVQTEANVPGLWNKQVTVERYE